MKTATQKLDEYRKTLTDSQTDVLIKAFNYYNVMTGVGMIDELINKMELADNYNEIRRIAEAITSVTSDDDYYYITGTDNIEPLDDVTLSKLIVKIEAEK